MFGRAKISALTSEFVGTGVLTLVILSMAGRTQFPFFAAVAAGLAYLVLVLVFSDDRRPQFNPAVTLGLWTARKLPTLESIVTIASQMLGAAGAWQLSQYMLNQPLPNVGSEISWNVFTAQAVGAFVFMLMWAAAHQRETDNGRFAVIVGLALTVGFMIASLTASSNGLINPAVALGMQSWGWAFAAGPIVGAVLAATVHPLLFVAPKPTKAARVKASVKKSVKTVKKTVAKKKK